MDKPPTLRACVIDDLPFIARIYAYYVVHSTATFEEEPPTLEAWEDHWGAIGKLGLPFLVAELGHNVLGYGYCSRWRPRPAYRYTAEDSIYIDPQAVGHRLGSHLLAELVVRCEAAGVHQLIAVIAAGEHAPASLALHYRCGFSLAGRLKAVGFKHGQWLDTIVLQRALAATAT